MKVVNNKIELKELLHAQRLQSDQKIAFVPTMGALHQGHISLIEKARTMGCYVLSSIFVNPTQFNNASDFEKYPESTEQDLRLLKAAACDAVYLPFVTDLYPNWPETHKRPIDYGAITSSLEGHFRPGHFDGVVQVVGLFFELIQPDIALFGEKDFQQLQVVRTLGKLHFPSIQIVAGETLREANGLAMSSRNQRLSAQERQNASVIITSMRKAANELKQGKHWGDVKKRAIKAIESVRPFEVEYFELVNEENFEPLQHLPSGCYARLFTATFCRDIRLIDNIAVSKS